ncbi:MAG TPA: amidase family protein, partial [Ramlibacter sp.]|nr:amidase family protein [Ramlibacter sp.]
MPDDLHATRGRLLEGGTTVAQVLALAEQAANAPACRNAFLSTSFERARQQAPAGAGKPLAGLPVSVKDLFDVAGETTAAGSTALAGSAPARADAVAVARLKAAGAAIVGRTNMTEFAFSGVGTNPHHGTP